MGAVPERILDLLKVLGGGVDRHDLLAGFNTGRRPDCLAEREAHPFRDTVCTAPVACLFSRRTWWG